MSTKVNKTAIGAFVLSAIALAVAGVLVLGAGKLFTKEYSYITYYEGSVKGLNVGSPVMFHGVKVGQVTDISITADPGTRKLMIPVIFSLQPEKFKGTRDDIQRGDPRGIKRAVDLGLRTQLQSQSFVTGQLLVALDMFPDKPARYYGLNKKYTEIPSVPTSLEQIQKTIENLPFKEIVENFNETLMAVKKVVSSIDARKTSETIEAAIRDAQALVRHVDAKVDPLLESVTRTSGAAEAALNETRETMTSFRGDMKEVVASAKPALDAAQTALRQSEQTLRAYSDDSRLVTELNRTLRDLSATSRSLRHLSDYLERHPESLLRGKAEARGD